MKFSKKMILVPSTVSEVPEIDKISEMDEDMSHVLKNKLLSVKEKIEMYNEILRKHIIFRVLQKPQVKIEEPVTNTILEIKQPINSFNEINEEKEEEEEEEEEKQKLFENFYDDFLQYRNHLNENTTIKSTNNDTHISDWNDIDNVSTRNTKRQKNIINYNESPSSLLNSAKKRKNKQKYKLKKKKYN